MRLGTFNVENLFSRPRVMNLPEWSDGRGVLSEFSLITALLQEPVYSAAIKAEILERLGRIGIGSTDESKWAILRQNRGRLLRRPQSGGVEVSASGRGDWVGWLELKTEAVDEIAMQMTARVVKDLNVDVLAVVEAEDRIALQRFNEQLLTPIGAAYQHIMLIDGNDDRGIDVGVMTRRGYTVESVASHVDDVAQGRRVFSRDCPEYFIRLENGTPILIMINHFKSKGYGGKVASDARRHAQASRVRQIYDARRASGIDLIAVVGDLNDTPTSAPLEPLLGNGSDLRDTSAHPHYVSDGRPGTYGNGTDTDKIDYVLLSPAMFDRVTGAGVLRKGVWGGNTALSSLITPR